MTAQPMKAIILDLLQQAHLDEEAFVQALDETERTAIGTPELWSAKDHLAHMTFSLHQNLIQHVKKDSLPLHPSAPMSLTRQGNFPNSPIPGMSSTPTCCIYARSARQQLRSCQTRKRTNRSIIPGSRESR